MTDDDLKRTLRAMADANGFVISDAEINLALPAFKLQLETMRAFDAVTLATEDEPATAFRLSSERGSPSRVR